MPPMAAEMEYNNALSRLTGEQYELLPPTEEQFYTMPSALYTIRHVLRMGPTNSKVMGIYYVVEGVIYKGPAVRSLMKTNVTRTLEGLTGATESLSHCARFHPSIGYLWVFGGEEMDPVALVKQAKRRKRRKILDNRPVGKRTAAEEEGIRASEAIDQILVRLSRSKLLKPAPSKKTTESRKGEIASSSTPTNAAENALVSA